jgi:hypothetical protein
VTDEEVDNVINVDFDRRSQVKEVLTSAYAYVSEAKSIGDVVLVVTTGDSVALFSTKIKYPEVFAYLMEFLKDKILEEGIFDDYN